MLFISVCSSEKRQVHKVLQVAEETKRLRHKAGRWPRSASDPFALLRIKRR